VCSSDLKCRNLTNKILRRPTQHASSQHVSELRKKQTKSHACILHVERRPDMRGQAGVAADVVPVLENLRVGTGYNAVRHVSILGHLCCLDWRHYHEGLRAHESCAYARPH